MQQNPDIVLVHYLNVPSLEDSGKCSPLLCTVASRHDSMRWSRDDLLSQFKPMCKTAAGSRHTLSRYVCRVHVVLHLCTSVHSMKWSGGPGEFSIEDLVQHILERQRAKPQPRTHTCLCNTVQGN